MYDACGTIFNIRWDGKGAYLNFRPPKSQNIFRKLHI